MPLHALSAAFLCVQMHPDTLIFEICVTLFENVTRTHFKSHIQIISKYTHLSAPGSIWAVLLKNYSWI